MPATKNVKSLQALKQLRTYYFIHDNGGRPYLVYVDNKMVYVYKPNDRHSTGDWSEQDSKNKWLYTKRVHVFKTRNIFIGKSKNGRKSFIGNTILLQTSKSTYVYIGSKIIRFRTLVQITTYKSPVGNNDVPYPYAIDKNGKYYLMVENVIIDNVPRKYKKRPYVYYYIANLITPDVRRRPPLKPLLDTGIEHFYIGKDEYTLTLDMRPGRDFDRLKRMFKQDLFITNTGETKKVKLTRRKYINIMKHFAKQLNVRPIKK